MKPYLFLENPLPLPIDTNSMDEMKKRKAEKDYGVIVDPELNKYDGTIMYPEKHERAKQRLIDHPLPPIPWPEGLDDEGNLIE
jgi:hypothetical protein